MANTNKPFGLAPVRSLSGTWGEQTTRYRIPSTDGTAYYIGSAVRTVSGADANGVSDVIIASGTDTLRGVIVGVEPANWNPISLVGTALNLENTNIPATKARDYYVYVVDDPHVVFTIQGDATATKQTTAYANSNFTLTVATGSTAQSLAGTVINSSSLATTSSLNMKAMGLLQVPNNAFGAYAIWQCMINLHELSGAGTTAY
jgi:hypothetical protein